MKTPLKTTLILALLSLPAAAQQKVSERTSLAAAALAPATDLLPVVDASAGLSGSKKITINDVFTGWGFTAAGESLAKAANAAAQRTALGLGTAATQAGTAFEPALGNPGTTGYVLSSSMAGVRSWVPAATGTGDLLSTNNLSDLASAASARSNLGLGTAATLGHGTAAGNLVRLDVSTGKLPAVDGSLLTNLPGGALASQAEAEAGSENSKTMTPLRTAQAITAQAVNLTGAQTIGGDKMFNDNLYMYGITQIIELLGSQMNIGPGDITLSVGSDATGDLLYRSAASGKLARIPIGTAGQYLKVVAGVPAWATITGGGDLLSTNNLSNLANAATARSNLGLAIGTNVQAWDADLDTWAGKTAPSGTVVGTSDTQTLTGKTLTSPVINVTSDATGDIYYRSAGGALTRLGVGSTGQVLTVAGGLPSWAATSSGTGDLLSTNNLSDLANAATARSNLGLAIGTNVQAWDADLDTWAGKTAPSGTVVGTSDTQTLTGKTLTSPVINVTSDATGDIYYRSAGGAFTRLSVGSAGQVLTVAAGLPSWAAAAGGLTNFTEAVNTATPNATIPVVTLTATNAATNVDLALIPKGTSGALLADIPDNLTAGGNKRGAQAVDLQMSRGANTQVASGANSVIAGGGTNTSSSIYTTVGGGSNNNCSGSYATIAGGRDGIASSTYGTVGGGNANNASGQGATIPGGALNTAAGTYAFSTGNVNAASGDYSTALNAQNTSSGPYSIATGNRATTRSLHGMAAHAAGMFASNGDAQSGRYQLRRATTDATITELSSDGVAPGASTRVVMPNNSTYSFRGTAAARSSGGDAKAWRFEGTIERGAAAANTAIIGSVTTTSDAESGASTWTLTIDADTTNGSLRFQGTGAAATNIRWTVSLETCELGY